MENDFDPRGKIYDAALFRRLLRYVRPYKGVAWLGLLLVLGAGGLVITGPVLIKMLIDEGLGKGNQDLVVMFAFIYLGVEAVRFLVEYGQMYMLQKLGQLAMRDLRMDVFRHLQKLPSSYFEENKIGRIVTRTTNDVQSLNELFSVGLVTLFKDVILVVAISITLLVMNFKLGLVTLAVAPLVGIAVFFFRRYLRQAYRRVRAAVSQVNSTVQENISGVRIAQLFQVEEDRYQRFRKDNDELRDSMIHSVRTHGLFQPFISVSAAMAMAMVFWYGGGRALEGLISLGVLVAFIEFMPHLITPIRDMGEKFTILQSAFAAAERVFGVLDTPVGVVDRPGLDPLPQARGEVEFENVHFGYKEGIEVLHGINLKIRAGERVALVGRTGSGKTTISRLLARFWEPWSGTVRLDGRELRGIPLADLRQSLSIVNQDLFIFVDSIMGNVRLGNETITREAAIEACRWTNAHTFVDRLPDGYDHKLTEGGRNLSVGERQLLSFARALVRRPAVLILDEATASVDTRTERLITEAMERITQGRTSIIIAHRLATVKNADRVVVIDDGRIVEEGPPEKLLAEDGIFQRMHALQFGGK